MTVSVSEGSCARERETLSAVLDGEASEADVWSAVRHVRHCLACREFVVAVVTTTRALRADVIRPTTAGVYDLTHSNGGTR